MIRHGAWAAALLKGASTAQKTFRIANGTEVQEIVLSLYPDQRGGQDGLPPEEASSAEPEGWAVSVAYKAAPDSFLFNRTFPTDREAQGAFEDLAKASATVEGLVRQEKMDEAKAATESLLKKFQSNSGETPILPVGQP